MYQRRWRGVGNRRTGKQPTMASKGVIGRIDHSYSFTKIRFEKMSLLFGESTSELLLKMWKQPLTTVRYVRLAASR
jgi:hypothetical protein